MVSETELATTKGIQQRTGKTFHLATRLLPRRVRHGTYVLYAFFRVADEVVDDPNAAPAADQRAELDRIEAAALGERAPDDPVLSAFGEVKERHGIDDREVEAFVDAMRMDVDTDRYESHEELSTYLRGSSVAVGHMMTTLMDPEDADAARPHAKALGEAFQLTNFLRDVREDVVDYGRIYVPRETLAAHGVEESTVEDLTFTPAFADAMRAELERTERLYDEGVAGIQYLPDDCQFAVLLSAVLYAEHHRLIRRRGYDVLSGRPSLGLARQLALIARTWVRWRRSGDPAEVFYAVGAVDRPEDRAGRDDASVVGSDHGDGQSGCWPLVGRPARSVARSARSLIGTVRTHLQP